MAEIAALSPHGSLTARNTRCQTEGCRNKSLARNVGPSWRHDLPRSHGERYGSAKPSEDIESSPRPAETCAPWDSNPEPAD